MSRHRKRIRVNLSEALLPVLLVTTVSGCLLFTSAWAYAADWPFGSNMILDGKQQTAARHSASAANFTMVTVLPAAPQITTVSPGSMPADSTINQTLTINGGIFKDGATLIFDPPTGSNINSTASKLTFVSSNRLSYELNNGGDAGTWTVTVINPDNKT